MVKAVDDGLTLTSDAMSDIAVAVWGHTINEDNIGATQTTAKDKVQGIWNRLFTKKTVTADTETAYELDNASAMETWTLADDDTTASRTP
jgi:hypothetical protein